MHSKIPHHGAVLTFCIIASSLFSPLFSPPGENGIMKKKSVLMQRDIEDQKEEMKHLLVKEKELHDQIKMLEKEVSAHKKEIKTRDVSIGEKEKRIYELKKKNQVRVHARVQVWRFIFLFFTHVCVLGLCGRWSVCR
jgi:septal ring factor EnvC (AmiA/AmiB activator)